MIFFLWQHLHGVFVVACLGGQAIFGSGYRGRVQFRSGFDLVQDGRAQAAEHNALLLETAWQRAFKKVVARDHQCCGLMLRMPGGSWGHGIRKNCAKVFSATETVIKSLELLLATRPALFDIAQAVSANS